MYTIEEIMEKFFDGGVDYKEIIKHEYRNAKLDIEKEDCEDLLHVVELLQNDKKENASSFLRTRDTEVKERLADILMNK